MTGDHEAPRYSAPTDLEGAVRAMAECAGGAVVIGGGTMVVPEMTHGRVEPSALVDLSRAGLAGIGDEDGQTVVGAMATYICVLGRPLPTDPGHPLNPLARMASGITGGPQIRNRGTLGGSAAYANPSSDVPGCLVALGARVRLASARGVREVPAERFYLGAFCTDRRPDEVLCALVLPRGEATAWGYVKFKTAGSSWPVVTAGAALLPGERLRVGVGAAADRPLVLHLPFPEYGTADPDWRVLVAEEFARALHEQGASAVEDPLAGAAYRTRITPVVVARAVDAALESGPYSRQERR